MSLLIDKRVLLIEDDMVDRKVVTHHLRQHLKKTEILYASTLKDAREIYQLQQPDFVICDYQLPDGNGMEIVDEVLVENPFMPIILLTGFGSEELAVKAIQSGACDYISKDNINPDRLREAIENSIQRRKMESNVYHLAHYDTLTRLYNRHHFEECLRHALSRSGRYRYPIAVLFLDLDGFKAINDQYGHKMGDAALIEVAGRLQECVRETDIVARFGGDEFAVIMEQLPNQQEGCCYLIGNRILHAIRQPYSLLGKTLNLGVSVGIVTHSTASAPPDELLRMADQAMYDAKFSNGHSLTLTTDR